MPRDQILVHCENCKMPSTVTRALWNRIKGRMACGGCRKTTTWKAS